jgi:hypothetical protein
MAKKKDDEPKEKTKLTLEVRRIRTGIRGGVDEWGQCTEQSISDHCPPPKTGKG